jgi:catechol 2,3-dioxygenase-like lactoylglutathione lyase family enzyme
VLSALALLATFIASPVSAQLSLQRATLTVSDLDASTTFYTQVIGFTVSGRSAYDTPALRTMFDLEEGSEPQLVLLDASGDQPRALALIAATGKTIDANANRRNAPALVLNTGDIDALHERARLAGVEVLLPPTPLNDFSGKPFGREAAYFDPDGVRVVVFQYD